MQGALEDAAKAMGLEQVVEKAAASKQLMRERERQEEARLVARALKRVARARKRLPDREAAKAEALFAAAEEELKQRGVLNAATPGLLY